MPDDEVKNIVDYLGRCRKGPPPDKPLYLFRDWIRSPDGPNDAATRHILYDLTIWMDDNGLNCFPNQDDIAATTGHSLRTVQRKLKLAEKKGWIAMYKIPASNGHFSNGYTIPPDILNTQKK